MARIYFLDKLKGEFTLFSKESNIFPLAVQKMTNINRMLWNFGNVNFLYKKSIKIIIIKNEPFQKGIFTVSIFYFQTFGCIIIMNVQKTNCKFAKFDIFPLFAYFWVISGNANNFFLVNEKVGWQWNLFHSKT